MTGAIMISIILFMIIFGLSEMPEAIGIALLAFGFLILPVFTAWELRNDSPLMDVRLFLRNRCFAFSNGAILIYFTANFATIFLVSLYLQYIKSFDSRSAGLVLLISTLITTPLVACAGRLSDRYSPHAIATVGIALTATGLLPMTFISFSTPTALALSGLMLIMAGGAVFSPPMVKLILGSIPREMYGLGSSLAETMRLIGNTVSMAITTVGFAIYMGESGIRPENYPAFLESMRLIVAIFLALCILTLGLAFFAGRAGRAKARAKV